MYIKVRVTAGAKEEVFEKKSKDHFDIKVKEKAQKNMANKRIIEIISKHFSTNNVKIINGHHSPSKLLSIGD
jgi:uncharacterized protein (TIGR00251 family)